MHKLKLTGSMITQRFLFICLLWCSVVDSFVPLMHPSRTAAPTRPCPTPRATTTELYFKRFFSKLLGSGRSITNKGNEEARIVSKVLAGRRTVNNFESTKVDEGVVKAAIGAAILAPNHKMTEPWRFILLGNETISEIAALNAAEIAKKDPIKGTKKKERWQAIPGWCVVTSKKSDGDLQEREDYAATCCAVQNFMLSLWVEGVGTKWTTGPITRTPEFAKLCGIDQTKEEVVGCIWYGIPSSKETRQHLSGRKLSRMSPAGVPRAYGRSKKPAS